MSTPFWQHTGPRLLLAALVAGCGSATESSPPPQEQSATPVVQAISPVSVALGTTRDLHISGTGFENGIKIDFTRTAVEPGLATTVLSVTSTEVVVRVVVASTTAIAAYNVVATNTSGKQGTGNGLLLVDQVAADELSAPPGGGVVTVVRPTGAAFGEVAGGCQDGDLGTPVQWDETGRSTTLSAPTGAGCRIEPLREVGANLYGRGSGIDANALNSAVIWSAAGVAQVFTVPQPPFGNRFVFDAVGPQGLFIGHAGGGAAVGARPFTWTDASGWQQIQMPPGLQICHPTDVGPAGEVVAQCFGPGPDQAVYWTNAGAAPTILPLPAGSTTAYAAAINAGRIVVGTAYLVGGPRAARWTPAGGGWSVELLPDLGNGSQAYRINDAGWIAGTDGMDNLARGVLWSPSGTIRTLSRLEADKFCGPSSIAASAPTTPPVVGGRCRRQGAFRPVVWRPN